MIRVNNNTGAQLGSASWGLLMESRNLLVFPIIGTIITAVLSVVAFVLINGTGLFSILNDYVPRRSSLPIGPIIVSLIVLMIYSFIVKLVIVYSNATLIGAIFEQVRTGKPATFGAGLNNANKHLLPVMLYAIIVALIEMLFIIGNGSKYKRNHVLGQVGKSVTLLMLPILIGENVNIIAALKRSAELFNQTWGENLAGRVQLGIHTFALSLAVIAPGLLVILIGYALHRSIPVMGLGAILFFTGIGFFRLLNNAVSAIFQFSLYSYATNNGEAHVLDNQLVANAFS